MSESLKQKTAKGLFWGALNSGTTQILNLIIGIILARHLTKADYGIIGILTIFIAIASDLQSAGFTQGLINIKRPTARDYNSVFSFNVCMSVLMYSVLFFSAPFIAEYFHQPCLVSVSRVVFLTFFISSLGIAHGGYMAKNMMNRELAIIGALALILSGAVGITLALLDFAYWSLAWQQVTYMIVVNIGRYYYVRDWRPRLSLDFGPVRLMAPFALKILVTKILNTLSANILTPIFARWFTIHQVGSYTQAFKWNTMAYSLVANTVGQIAQPVLVETDRSGLVAGYVGQTAIKTQDRIKEAMGGILFIDEAYSLSASKGENDFGQEAIDTILKAMEDNREDFIVIVAGYPKLMDDFLHSNPGLESRFNKHLFFDDYNPQELFDIFVSMEEGSSLKLDKKAEEFLKGHFEDVYKCRGENFANGRYVRNIFEKVLSNQADRLVNIEDISDEDLNTLIIEDFHDCW